MSEDKDGKITLPAVPGGSSTVDTTVDGDYNLLFHEEKIPSYMNTIGTEVETTINGLLTTLTVNQGFFNWSIYATKAELADEISKLKALVLPWVYHSTSKPTSAFCTDKTLNGLIAVQKGSYITSMYQNVNGTPIPLAMGLNAPVTNGGLRANSNGQLYFEPNDIDWDFLDNILKSFFLRKGSLIIGSGLVIDSDGKIGVDFTIFATIASVNAIQQQLADELSGAVNGLTASMTEQSRLQQAALDSAKTQLTQNLTNAQNALDSAIKANDKKHTNAQNALNSTIQANDKKYTDAQNALSQSIKDSENRQTANLTSLNTTLTNTINKNNEAVNNKLQNVDNTFNSVNNTLQEHNNMQSELQAANQSLSNSLGQYITNVNQSLVDLSEQIIQILELLNAFKQEIYDWLAANSCKFDYGIGLGYKGKHDADWVEDNGGFIDFHFMGEQTTLNGVAGGFTSRIIESARGILSLCSVRFGENGGAYGCAPIIGESKFFFGHVTNGVKCAVKFTNGLIIMWGACQANDQQDVFQTITVPSGFEFSNGLNYTVSATYMGTKHNQSSVPPSSDFEDERCQAWILSRLSNIIYPVRVNKVSNTQFSIYMDKWSAEFIAVGY